MEKTRDFDVMVEQLKGARAPQEVVAKMEDALGSLPARDAAPEVKAVAVGKRAHTGRARWMPAAVAACAALAVCLVAAPAIQNAGDAGAGTQAGQVASAPMQQLGRAFAVKQAFAKEAQASGPDIAFVDEGAGQAGEDGTFTGLLFQVEGQDIATVSARIDKGQLYRVARSQVAKDELERRLGDGTWGSDDAPGSIHMLFGDDGQATLTDDYCVPLGASFEEAYDAAVPYGFYLPADVLDPDAPAFEEDAGKGFFHAAFDAFDGATLEISVTYEDGSQATQSYKLASGILKVKEGKKGEPMQVLQEFEDNPADNPYIYGLLATLQ